MKRLNLLSVLYEAESRHNTSTTFSVVSFDELGFVRLIFLLHLKNRMFNRIYEDWKHSRTIALIAVYRLWRNFVSANGIKRRLRRIKANDKTLASMASITNKPKEMPDIESQFLTIWHVNSSSEDIFLVKTQCFSRRYVFRQKFDAVWHRLFNRHHRFEDIEILLTFKIGTRRNREALLAVNPLMVDADVVVAERDVVPASLVAVLNRLAVAVNGILDAVDVSSGKELRRGLWCVVSAEKWFNRIIQLAASHAFDWPFSNLIFRIPQESIFGCLVWKLSILIVQCSI